MRLVAATVFVDIEDVTRIREWLAVDGVEVIPTAALEDAVQTLAAAILFDADGRPDWAIALQQLVEMRPAARVIVLARNADNRMWAEVISLGAWDLLLKPLVALEVRPAMYSALQITMPVPVRAAA